MHKRFTKEEYSRYFTQTIIPSDYKGIIELELYQKSVDSEFNYIQNRIENIEYAQKFRKNCLIAHTTDNDYLAKEFWIEDICLVCSIRFMGGDLGKPFVSIEFYNCDNAVFFKNYPRLKDYILSQYEIFHPLFIHLVLRKEDEHFLKNIHHSVDRYYYSAPLQDIYLYQFPKTTPHFRIEKIEGLDDNEYDIYLKEYDAYRRENPDLGYVFAEPLSTINRICQNDYGFKIYINDEWAGFQLYASHTEYFFYGYLVWDKIIFKKHRGHHLSTYAQNKAFQYFIPRQNGFIYGQIDPLNTGSIQTAIRSGRKNLLSTFKLY